MSILGANLMLDKISIFAEKSSKFDSKEEEKQPTYYGPTSSQTELVDGEK